MKKIVMIITIGAAIVLPVALFQDSTSSLVNAKTIDSSKVVRYAKKTIPAQEFNRGKVLETAPVLVSPNREEVRSKPKMDRVSISKRKLQSMIESGKLKKMLTDSQLAALVLQESDNRNIIGDKHLGDDPNLWAWGKLQIRKCYTDDVNEVFGTEIYASDCLHDLELSILVTQAYMNRFAPDGASFEVMARIHNGGPKGYVRSKTVKYWKEVRHELASITDNRTLEILKK